MSSKLKPGVALAAVRLSATFTSSARRSQKTWNDLTAELRAERTNFSQAILPDEEDSFVGMDKSSMGLDETPISASRSQKTWSDLTAELRAEKIKFPQIIVPDEDEEDNIFAGMDESSMDLDEAPVSSSSYVVCESPSKFKRPASLPWKRELANSVSLNGTIEDHVRFEYTNSGKPLAWTSLRGMDKNHRGSFIFNYRRQYKFRVGLYFSDELANIANQHLRKNDYVHVSGELKQQKCKMWVMGKDLKFIQSRITPNSGKHRFFKVTELWKALFDNPLEWYDHREQK
ncbi:hypothetical protein KI387_012973, partial [Taxus chinensis]